MPIGLLQRYTRWSSGKPDKTASIRAVHSTPILHSIAIASQLVSGYYLRHPSPLVENTSISPLLENVASVEIVSIRQLHQLDVCPVSNSSDINYSLSRGVVVAWSESEGE